MTISDANPIKLWLNGVKTFNESTFSGVVSQCFLQKWNLTDSIKLQINAIDTIILVLRIYDKDGNAVASKNFTNYATYYEIDFSFAEFALAEDKYRLQVEVPYQMDFGTGVFTLTGQNIDFLYTQNKQVAIDFGTFTLTGQSITLIYASATLNLQAVLNTAFGLQHFQCSFDGTVLTVIGNGGTDAGTKNYTAAVTVTIIKTTNLGVAQDVGSIQFYVNGILQSTQTFNVGDSITGTSHQYTFTGLVPLDILKVVITEG